MSLIYTIPSVCTHKNSYTNIDKDTIIYTSSLTLHSVNSNTLKLNSSHYTSHTSSIQYCTSYSNTVCTVDIQNNIVLWLYSINEHKFMQQRSVALHDLNYDLHNQQCTKLQYINNNTILLQYNNKLYQYNINDNTVVALDINDVIWFHYTSDTLYYQTSGNILYSRVNNQSYTLYNKLNYHMITVNDISTDIVLIVTQHTVELYNTQNKTVIDMLFNKSPLCSHGVSADSTRYYSINNCNNQLIEYRITHDSINVLHKYDVALPDSTQLTSFVQSTDKHVTLYTSTQQFVIYDTQSNSIQFSTVAAHNETIYDIQYTAPNDSTAYITCSSDSRVKLYKNNQCTATLDIQYNRRLYPVYTISINPLNTDQLLVGAGNTVQLWSIQQQRCLKVYTHHTDLVHCVRYNIDGAIAASTSRDGTCVIFNTTSSCLLHRYRHDSIVYQCNWSTHNTSLLVTSCHDSHIRIYDINNTTVQPIQMLTGHTARVYCIQFSLNNDKQLVSGSDDKTVRIWTQSTDGTYSSNVLSGHSEPIRCITMNTELQSVMLSGGLNGELCIWNSNTMKLIKRLHVQSDIYNIITHSHNPFHYSVTSIDSGISTLTIDDIVQPCLIQSVVHNGIIHDSAGTVGLIGRRAHELKQLQQTHTQPIEHYISLLSYFVPGEHKLHDMLQLVKSIVTNSKLSNASSIHKLNEWPQAILSATKQQLLSHHTDPHTLQQLSDVYLQHGQIYDYCENEILLNNWMNVLIASPNISVPYWKYNISRYVQYCIKSDRINPYEMNKLLLLSGDVDGVIESYLGQNQIDRAIYTELCQCNHLLTNLPKLDQSMIDTFHTTRSVRSFTPTESLKQMYTMKNNQLQQNQQYIDIAINNLLLHDIPNAIISLNQSTTILYGYILCRVFNIRDCSIYKSMSQLCWTNELYYDGLVVLLQNNELQKNDIEQYIEQCPNNIHTQLWLQLKR